MESKVGMVTRSGRRLSVDKLELNDETSQSAVSTPTKKRGRRLSTKPDLEDLPETDAQNENASTENSQNVANNMPEDNSMKDLPSHVVGSDAVDSPARTLRNRNVTLPSPLGTKLKESITPKKAVRKIESSLMPNIVDSPKLRKNKKLENVEIDLTQVRRSRRLSGELNVVIEDPVREEEPLKTLSRKSKRLSVAPAHPSLPEENEDIKETENVKQLSDIPEDVKMKETENVEEMKDENIQEVKEETTESQDAKHESNEETELTESLKITIEDNDSVMNKSNDDTKLCSPVSVVLKRLEKQDVKNMEQNNKSVADLESSNTDVSNVCSSQSPKKVDVLSSPTPLNKSTASNRSLVLSLTPSPMKSINASIEETKGEDIDVKGSQDDKSLDKSDQSIKDTSVDQNDDKDTDATNNDKPNQSIILSNSVSDDKVTMDNVVDDDEMDSSCDIIPESQDVDQTSIIKANTLNRSLKESILSRSKDTSLNTSVKDTSLNTSVKDTSLNTSVKDATFTKSVKDTSLNTSVKDTSLNTSVKDATFNKSVKDTNLDVISVKDTSFNKSVKDTSVMDTSILNELNTNNKFEGRKSLGDTSRMIIDDEDDNIINVSNDSSKENVVDNSQHIHSESEETKSDDVLITSESKIEMIEDDSESKDTNNANEDEPSEIEISFNSSMEGIEVYNEDLEKTSECNNSIIGKTSVEESNENNESQNLNTSIQSKSLNSSRRLSKRESIDASVVNKITNDENLEQNKSLNSSKQLSKRVSIDPAIDDQEKESEQTANISIKSLNSSKRLSKRVSIDASGDDKNISEDEESEKTVNTSRKSLNSSKRLSKRESLNMSVDESEEPINTSMESKSLNSSKRLSKRISVDASSDDKNISEDDKSEKTMNTSRKSLNSSKRLSMSENIDDKNTSENDESEKIVNVSRKSLNSSKRLSKRESFNMSVDEKDTSENKESEKIVNTSRKSLNSSKNLSKRESLDMSVDKKDTSENEESEKNVNTSRKSLNSSKRLSKRVSIDAASNDKNKSKVEELEENEESDNTVNTSRKSLNSSKAKRESIDASSADKSVSEDKGSETIEENSSNDESEDFVKLQFIDESASEAGSDYKSGDSLGDSEREEMDLNEIVDVGESLNSDSHGDDSDVSSYEKDSFVCSDEELMESETSDHEIMQENTNLEETQNTTDTKEDKETDNKDADKKVEGTWIVSSLKPLSETGENTSKRRKLEDGAKDWTNTAGEFNILDREITDRPTRPITASDFGSTTSFKVINLKKNPKYILTCDPMSSSNFKENILYGKHIRRKDSNATNNINQKIKASNLHKKV